MNNPLIFTDPSGYRPVLIFEAEEHYLRQNPGVDFDYFAGYNASGRYDPYHRYRSFHDRFSSAENVGRFSRNPGPIDIYHDEESGESYYIYQSALNGLAYYEKDVDFGYFESYEKDKYIDGYSVNGIRKQIKESGVRYISNILTFRFYVSLAANGGDGSEVFRAIFTGVAITTEAGNALSRFNSNELKKLQKILETNHNVNSIKINNQLLKVARNGNIIKGIGFVGNVANLGAIGFDIIQHGGNITTENALDATFGVVAFVPTVGWVISSAYSLNKEASKTGYYFSGDMIMW